MEIKNSESKKLKKYFREGNIELHDIIALSGDYDDDYVDIMMKFMSSINYINIRIIKDGVEDFNSELKFIDDFKSFIEFYDKVDGEIDGGIFFRKEAKVKFIESDKFQELMREIIMWLPDRETIILNKYLVNTIYSTYDLNYTNLSEEEINEGYYGD